MVIDKIRLYDFINKIKSFDKLTHNNKIQYYGFFTKIWFEDFYVFNGNVYDEM